MGPVAVGRGGATGDGGRPGSTGRRGRRPPGAGDAGPGGDQRRVVVVPGTRLLRDDGRRRLARQPGGPVQRRADGSGYGRRHPRRGGRPRPERSCRSVGGGGRGGPDGGRPGPPIGSWHRRGGQPVLRDLARPVGRVRTSAALGPLAVRRGQVIAQLRRGAPTPVGTVRPATSSGHGGAPPVRSVTA